MEGGLWEGKINCREGKVIVRKVAQKLLVTSETQPNDDPRQSGTKVGLIKKRLTEKTPLIIKKVSRINKNQIKTYTATIRRSITTKEIRRKHNSRYVHIENQLTLIITSSIERYIQAQFQI